MTDKLNGSIWTGPIDTLQLAPVPLQDVKQPLAVDYDPVESMVYWTDVELQTISRAFLDGTGQEVVVDSLSGKWTLSLRGGVR